MYLSGSGKHLPITFQMVEADFRATAQVDAELFFCARDKGVEFLHEFDAVLCNAFFPNEGVLARNCFDLCAVDKEVLKRDGSNGCKKLCHFCQNLLGAGGQSDPCENGQWLCDPVRVALRVDT